MQKRYLDLGISKGHSLSRVDFPKFCAYCTSYTDLHPNRTGGYGQKFIYSHKYGFHATDFYGQRNLTTLRATNVMQSGREA